MAISKAPAKKAGKKAPPANDNIVFIWEGLDKKGSRVKGEVVATSEILAKADLRRQGMNPLRVRKKPKPLFGAKKKIIPKDIAIFLRQMATMMQAGVPLVQAFEIVGRGHENPAMQELILKIKSDVESGTTFSAALAEHPRYFDDLVVNLVGAGEQAGALENLLDKVATYKEKTESLKAKIKKALFYPTAVIVVAFIVTAILLIKVVPQFQDLFQGFGADLPVFTQMVIQLSEMFQAYWWAIFGAIIVVAFVYREAHVRSKNFRRQVDLLSLRLPIVGELLRKASIARFARTLSTMFSAGVPLVEAMESVAGATGNALYYEGTLRMRDETAGGAQLQQAMRNTGLFPNMVVQMVSIGEESGALDDMLAKVADFYEEEVDNMVDAMSSLLEPLIMSFLGIVVGGLVIAMYLPIFQLGSVV